MSKSTERKKINILVTNDDGFGKAGLAALVDALSERANVYVSVPDTERSAKSHSITMKRAIHIKRVEMNNAIYAMTTDGTPADCVKAGLNVLHENGVEIDAVFSGINHGANLGVDTLYSGTVAGAIEGSLCGKPGVSVSVCSHQATHFKYAAELAVKCIDKLEGNRVLSINVPDIPYEEIKGVRVTALGKIDYKPWFNVEEGSDEIEKLDVYYRYRGKPEYFETDESIDTVAVEHGYASISPLDYDFSDFRYIEEMKRWKL